MSSNIDNTLLDAFSTARALPIVSDWELLQLAIKVGDFHKAFNRLERRGQALVREINGLAPKAKQVAA